MKTDVITDTWYELEVRHDSGHWYATSENFAGLLKAIEACEQRNFASSQRYRVVRKTMTTEVIEP